MIKRGIYDKAKLVPSPNKGGEIKPTAIIVHDTAGSLRKGSSVSWLTNPEARASAHFVVERDGTVTQLVSCNVKAWHAGKSDLDGRSNVNDFSVGIEFVNPGALQASGVSGARAYFGEVFDRKKYKIEELPDQRATVTGGEAKITHKAALWMPYTEEQIKAGLALCLAIRNTYDIQHLAPHWYISPGRKIDTNPLFPLAWFMGRLAGRSDEEPAKRMGELVTGAVIRRWPTFFPSNTLDVSYNKVEILGLELHPIQGEDILAPLLGRKLEWLRVRLPSGLEAFVDPSDVAEI